MKHIIIIGGGFAGSRAAQRLEKHFKVTLIDDKDYFEFTPSVPRVVIEPDHRKRIEVKHRDYLKETTFINGTVKEVHEHSLTLVDGKNITFDYLFICSGSKYSQPFKERNVISSTRGFHLGAVHDQLVLAKKVLVVGGGPVGVEIAAEIIHKYPKKEVTLVHAMQRLIERSPESASKKAVHYLEKRGVKILLNEWVTTVNTKKATTKSGKEISFDLSFICTGIVCNTSFMQPYLKTTLDEKARIRVNEFLQVKGYPHMFCCGDANDIAEEKLAQTAENQADLACDNLMHQINQKELHKYVPKPRTMVLSLGKYDGIIMYKNFVFPGLPAAIAKTLIERMVMREKK